MFTTVLRSSWFSVMFFSRVSFKVLDILFIEVRKRERNDLSLETPLRITTEFRCSWFSQSRIFLVSMLRCWIFLLKMRKGTQNCTSLRSSSYIYQRDSRVMFSVINSVCSVPHVVVRKCWMRIYQKDAKRYNGTPQISTTAFLWSHNPSIHALLFLLGSVESPRDGEDARRWDMPKVCAGESDDSGTCLERMGCQ